MNEQITEIREKILNALKRNDVKHASLFGSVVRGELTDESDIDVLVGFRGRKSLLDLVGLKLELEEVLKREILKIKHGLKTNFRTVEEITFKTEDGVKISGNYFKPEKEHSPVFLLLHMMPSTKESWNTFASLLHEKGFAVLAIDLRGHGGSRDKNGTKLDYKEFKDAQHRESMKDIAAAKDFLASKKEADISRLAIAGASIGANLALLQASMDKDVRLLVLLSAGLNYRGIQTAQLAPGYRGPVYILASEGDTTNAAQSSRQLFEIFPGDKKLEIIKGDSHGTNMFISEPDLMDKLLDWIILKMK